MTTEWLQVETKQVTDPLLLSKKWRKTWIFCEQVIVNVALKEKLNYNKAYENR
jgi:hypothetical protein